MIRPEEFYTPNDLPDKRKKEAMWAGIRGRLAPPQAEPFLVRDRRSFLFGMAASLILGLALYGGWSITRQAFEEARPQPIRLEQAYVSAIREFERVVPSVIVKSSQMPQSAGQLTQRRDQLKLVDAAIAELRRQTNGSDLSPLKRDHLRQLYSMKLNILQQMIEEGEIEI